MKNVFIRTQMELCYHKGTITSIYIHVMVVTWCKFLVLVTTTITNDKSTDVREEVLKSDFVIF